MCCILLLNVPCGGLFHRRFFWFYGTKIGNPLVTNKCFEKKVLNENIGDVLLKILWNTIFLNNLSYNKEKVVFLQL